MKAGALNNNDLKKESKIRDYPELQVGFPERNDVSSPNMEMERIHVDFDTLNISRKSDSEFTREITRKD